MAINCLRSLRSTPLLYTRGGAVDARKAWWLFAFRCSLFAKGEERSANSVPSLIYHPSVLDLTTSVQYVKGIGPKFAQILLEKGIATVEDLLYYLPFRYEDRLNPRGIGELRVGEMASIIADVRTFGLFRTRRMPIFEMTVGQGRDTLKCIWFNATYLQDKFRAGMTLALYGKVEAGDRGGHRFEVIQPQFEILHDPSAMPGEGRRRRAGLEVARDRAHRPHLRNGRQWTPYRALVPARDSRPAGEPDCRHS